MSEKESTQRKLTKNLSPLGAWAFAIGTSIGWGSLVVTTNSYLGEAGPLGSVIGMVIGAVIMLIISKNYAYLMSSYPDSGGAYTYAKEIFGYDHGFLTAWFLALTYLAILWANATSLPLFARYFFGDIFRFGKLYTIFGYDVYLGEALLTIVAIILFALLLARFKNAVSKAMIVMAILFTVGITVCFFFAVFRHSGSMSPSFIPDSSVFSQIIKIACISPWAFIGFECISHGTEEFNFKRTKIFRVLVIAVISTTLLYVCIMLLSVSAYPQEYSSWLDYIKNLGSETGIRALPAFYAANHYMGSFGVTILMVSLLALIFTSFIGNITALSRLFGALGRDNILPSVFGKLNKHGVPGKAILLIAGISILIPFLGRTAIGWIVDVTTLGATLIYGFVSAAAAKQSIKCADKKERITGVAGLIICIGFGLYMLLPNLFGTGTMETESFFLFVVWAVLGFVYFRIILKRDNHKRFGKSIIVWIALLSLVLFVSLVWMSRSIMDATDKGMGYVEDYYVASGLSGEASGVVSSQLGMIRSVSARSIIVVVFVFILSLGILLNNYRTMSKKAEHSELQLWHVQNLAFTDTLTGVKSKLAYTDTENEINDRIASGNSVPFSVVVCDVNGLKHINDTLGHKAGDEYIQKAAKMICGLFVHSPVYRIGGDEFVVILSDSDYLNRSVIVKQLHDMSVENIEKGGVVVSAGISDYEPGVSDSLKSVFEKADTLMYQEKKLLKSMGAATRS